ncbi:hypothetical protein ABVT39_017807 [Epinephelus coioides]
MLQIQREHFTELLQQQQNTCEDFIKLILDNSNKRLDDLTRENQELKICLQYTQNEVDTLKTDNIKLSAELKTLQTERLKASEGLLSSATRMEYLDAQSRRNNLVFEALPESPNETWAES